MKNVLFHVEDTEKKRQILKLCRRLGLSAKTLAKEDLHTEIGTLVEMEAGLRILSQKPMAALGTQDAMPDVMVFAGMGEGRLDRFLEEYQKAGIAPIPLKAVATPYNIRWTLGGLISELVKEEREMARRKN